MALQIFVIIYTDSMAWLAMSLFSLFIQAESERSVINLGVYNNVLFLLWKIEI